MSQKNIFSLVVMLYLLCKFSQNWPLSFSQATVYSWWRPMSLAMPWVWSTLRTLELSWLPSTHSPKPWGCLMMTLKASRSSMVSVKCGRQYWNDQLQLRDFITCIKFIFEVFINIFFFLSMLLFLQVYQQTNHCQLSSRRSRRWMYVMKTSYLML